jgi:hypothetical protein
LIYVARGSHAAYFEHATAGHRTKSLSHPKGLPWLPGVIVSTAQRWIVNVIVWLRWNDRTTTHPDYPEAEPWNRGEFVHPSLVILPRMDEVTTDGPFWWMNILCRWGSRHSRLRGTAAPFPAWDQKARYDDPLAWLERLIDRRRALTPAAPGCLMFFDPATRPGLDRESDRGRRGIQALSVVAMASLDRRRLPVELCGSGAFE